MRIRCWVRAISSRWTELTSSSCWRARSRSADRTDSSSCSRPARPCSTSVAPGRGQVDRAVQVGQHDPAGGDDGGGGPALADQPLAALGGLRARLALSGRGPHQLVRPAVQRPGPLLRGAQRQPRLHLGLAGGAGRLGERLAGGGVGLLVGGVLRVGQPALQVREARQVAVAGLLGGGDRLGHAGGLGARRPGLGAVLPQLLGHRGEGRVGLVQPGEGDVGAHLRVQPLRLEPRGVEREPFGGRHRLGQRVGGLLDRGLDLDQARLLRGAAVREVGAEHVTVAGDRGDVRQLADEGAGGVEVGHDRDLVEQPRERALQVGGRLHHVDGVRRPGRAGRASRRRSARRRRAAARRARGRRLLRCSRASTAAAGSRTATASAALPRAPASAAS